VGVNAAEERSRRDDNRETAQREAFPVDADYLFSKWPREMLDAGDQVVGFSFVQKPDGWLLVIRARVDGLRQVAFLFDHSTTGCVSLAALKARSGTLHWRIDEYA
jgi:hypothetical protein